jgi:hypothetical protein
VLAVGAAVGLTAWWLFSVLPPLKPTQAATVRIDVIRTALAAGAGAGAAITLMLAFRRQRHQEIVAASTEHDANERRVTELYTKAAEQLGNDQAPVRLAGLYALERLAQDNPDQRQTIVNVICAYLRMPYTAPREDRPDKIRTAQRTARHGALAHSNSVAGGRDSLEEQQVRLTAQRILADHLRYINAPPPGRGRRGAADLNARFWPRIRLDLTGAILFDFDFADCRAVVASFRGATFSGDASFRGATISGYTSFDEAAFSGEAHFSGTVFLDVSFNGATFSGDAWFNGATFFGDAWFNGATFFGSASFYGTTFHSGPKFSEEGAERVDLTDADVRVAQEPGPRRGQVWPTGWRWRLESDPDGSTRLRARGAARTRGRDGRGARGDGLT